MKEDLAERAILLYQQGLTAKALPLLRQALAQRPNDARLATYLSCALWDLEHLDDALSVVEGALASSPTSTWSHRIRSGILSAIHRYDEALKSAEEALRLKPNSLHSCVTYSVRLFDVGRYEDAQVAAQSAIAIDPQSASAWSAMGHAYRALGDKERAREAFLQAARIDPEQGMFGLAFVTSGVEGMDLYRRLLQLDPSDSITQSNLALRLARLGRWEEALAVVAVTLEADPKNALALEVYARASLNSGRLANAVAVEGRLEELAHECAGQRNEYRAYEALGHVSLARKDYAGARERYGRALDLKDWCCLAVGVGRAAAALGNASEAQAMHQRALAKNPCDSKCALLCKLREELAATD